jgi:hypothetical protein
MDLFNKVSGVKLKWQVLTAIAVVFLSLLAVSIYLAYAPVKKLQQLNQFALADSAYMQEEGKQYNQQSLLGISREKAMKTARLELAANDSIGLIIHIADSLVSLSIRGMSIHKSHILRYQNDQVLLSLDNAAYMKMFSKPLKILSQEATIAKEPIVIKKAPKNPEEAALAPFQPDTIKPEQISVNLHLEFGILIKLEQEGQDFNNGGFWYQLVTAFINYRNQFTTGIDGYTPAIKIQIPAEDLIAIYRALPQDASVVISF